VYNSDHESTIQKRGGNKQMANSISKLVVSFVLTAALVVALGGTAGAKTGYFSHGYGVKYKSMAGAGVAVALSAFAPAINPGALAFVGQRYEVDLAVFSPDRSYTVMGAPSPPPAFGLAPGTYESVNSSFLIPGFAANWVLEEEDVAIGVAAYANGGMNTEWQTNTFQGSIPTGVNLEQLFIAMTMAYKAMNKHGIGVTPILAYQRFQAEGLEAFGAQGFSSDHTKLTNNGHDRISTPACLPSKAGSMSRRPGRLASASRRAKTWPSPSTSSRSATRRSSPSATRCSPTSRLPSSVMTTALVLAGWTYLFSRVACSTRVMRTGRGGPGIPTTNSRSQSPR
jgi:hypothetical protein